MANSGNGTFIPMVSSSPPPMDDGEFDFDDDDDDEFSGFSSAPFGQGLDSPPGKWTKSNSQNNGGIFPPVRDEPPDPFHSTNEHSPNNGDDFGSFAAFDHSSSTVSSQNHGDNLAHIPNDALRDIPVNGISIKDGDDDEEDDNHFADFASFKSNVPQGSIEEDKVLGTFNRTERSIDSSDTLNKNNSHEKFNTGTLDSDSFSQNTSAVNNNSVSDWNSIRKTEDEGGKEDIKAQGLSVTEVNSSGNKTNCAGTQDEVNSKLTVLESGSIDPLSLDQADPEPLSFPNPKSAQESKDTFANAQETLPNAPECQVNAPESEANKETVQLKEKPSTGILNLFQESDRQTFDSGIDSVMTPSDSSPEGKEVTPGSTDTGSRPSMDLSPTAEGEDWGDFDTCSSNAQSFDNHKDQFPNSRRSDNGTHKGVTLETNDDKDDFGDFGSFSQLQIPGSESQKGPENLQQFAAETGQGKGKDLESSSVPKIQMQKDGDGEDDDDDEFGDFSSVSKGSADTISQSSRQDFDDFGDFESTQSTRSNDSGNKSAPDKAEDDWSGFSSGKTSQPSETEAFGDFGSFDSSPSLDSTGKVEQSASLKLDKSSEIGSFGSGPVSPSVSAIHHHFDANRSTFPSQVPPGGRVERLFKSCFPNSTVGGGAGVSPDQADQPSVVILETVVATSEDSSQQPGGQDTSRDKGSNKKKSVKSVSSCKAVVWTSLSDMENTLAQKYHWNSSRNSGRLLSSLGIDSRNILSSGRKGLPLFAQGVGMLTPSKPGEGTERAPSNGGEMGSESEDVAPSGLTVTAEDPPPKVEFDWSNSGLINPLDANSLNLDFFATERKSSSSRAKNKTGKKVDPELLDLAVSPSEPPLKQTSSTSSSALTSSHASSASSSQKTNALDEILKHSSTSMVKQRAKREPGLSTEANSVLDSLPDLSYMLAKVLMFPVSSPTKTAAEDGGR